MYPIEQNTIGAGSHRRKGRTTIFKYASRCSAEQRTGIIENTLEMSQQFTEQPNKERNPILIINNISTSTHLFTQ